MKSEDDDDEEEKKKRSVGEEDSYEDSGPHSPRKRGEPLNKDAKLFKRRGNMMEPTGLDYAKVFLWASIGMIGFGGLTVVLGRGGIVRKQVKRAAVSKAQLQ